MGIRDGGNILFSAALLWPLTVLVGASSSAVAPPAVAEVNLHTQPTARVDTFHLATDPVAAAGTHSDDKTGTTPLNFQRTFQISNEYDGITDSAEINYFRLRYTEPLASNFSLRLEVPLVYAHATIAGNAATGAGDGGSPAPGGPVDASAFGLGDIVLKASSVPYVTHEHGLLIAAELAAPTATDDVLGAEQWVFSPSATWATFFPNGMLFAPAYKHAIGFAADDARADIHQGSLDFYLVYKFDKGRQWVTLDPTYFLDYENNAYSGATFRFTYGRLLGKAGDAAISGYIRPGIGIGSDRPYDWSLEIAITLIGFKSSIRT